MKSPEIEAKTHVLDKVITAVVITAAVIIIMFKFSDMLFHWERFNPDGIFTVGFLILFLIFILCWIRPLDTQPKLRVNENGVWIRSTILPFSRLNLIRWTEIKFIELDLVKEKGGSTTFLVIHRKDSKANKIVLDNLNQQIDTIVDVVRNFSVILNYRDRAKITR